MYHACVVRSHNASRRRAPCRALPDDVNPNAGRQREARQACDVEPPSSGGADLPGLHCQAGAWHMRCTVQCTCFCTHTALQCLTSQPTARSLASPPLPPPPPLPSPPPFPSPQRSASASTHAPCMLLPCTPPPPPCTYAASVSPQASPHAYALHRSRHPCRRPSPQPPPHHPLCTLPRRRPLHPSDARGKVAVHVCTHPCCLRAHAHRTRGHRLSTTYGLQASKPSTPRQGIEAWRTPQSTPRPTAGGETPRPTAGGEAAGTGDDPTTAPPPPRPEPLPEPPPPPPPPAATPPPGQPPTLLNATAFLPQPDLPMPPTPPTPTLSPRGKNSQPRRATRGQQQLSGGRQSQSPVRPPSADGAERGASPGRRESQPGPWDGEAPSPGNRLSFPSEYVGLVNRPSSGARGLRPKSATRPGSASRSQVPPPAQRGGLTLSLPVTKPVAPYSYSLPRKGAPPSPEHLPRQRRLSRTMGACRSMGRSVS